MIKVRGLVASTALASVGRIDRAHPVGTGRAIIRATADRRRESTVSETPNMHQM